MPEPKHPTELTPEEHGHLELRPPQAKAAGWSSLQAVFGQVKDYLRPGTALRTLAQLNQHGGFDCPGCAWPDPDDERTPLSEYCENGVKAIAEEATKRRLTREFFARHSVAEIAEWSDFKIGKQGRLTEPMILDEGATHYRPATWAEALELVGNTLQQLDSPDEAIFYTSGRTSNEAAFMYQLFVREFGTNNLPDCSNMCHESSGRALSETLGHGKGSVTLQDLHESELIVIMGQNPGTNHPRMLKALERCKANGGQIITVNPLPEPGLLEFVNPQRPLQLLTGNGTSLTDLFLPIRINEDMALLRAILLILLEKEEAAPGSVFDREFIATYTSGYEALVAHLHTHDLDACLTATGIDPALVYRAAELIASKERIIFCWAMGLTQHRNSVALLQDIVNLVLLKGSIGKRGAGVCPVRGHSNVQGDRTVGIWEKLPPAFGDRLRDYFGFEPPRADGYDVVNAIKAMHDGRARVFFAMGGNFLSATPDTRFTAEALRRCDLTVQVSTKLNRSHLVTGRRAVILPCLGRTDLDLQDSGEQFVSCENSMGVVQRSKGILSPPAEALRSEPAIVAGVARATLGTRSVVDWEGFVANYDAIRDAIAATIPGFERYNERVRERGGFYLPNGPRERRFPTPDGKAHFTVSPLSTHQLAPGEYLMMTVRSHDQYNTTIYGLDDRYRGIHNERRVVLMNAADLEAAGLATRDQVDLVSNYDGTDRRADAFLVVPYPIPRGCVATYFPEANSLVPISVTARKSNTPISKSVVVRIIPRS
jgi:molybdopterin-dependent oxidoreductase alpha subunit